MPSILEYKCPNCGGALHFDSDVQSMKCPFCGTELEMENVEAYAEALEYTAQDELDWVQHSSHWQEGESSHLSVYTCQSCGGEIIQEESDIASSCPFCGNPVINTGRVSGSLRPDLIIPFKYDKKSAKEAYLRHCNKDFVPKVFLTPEHIDEIKGVYVPFWLYDAKADASMRYRASRTRSWREGEYRVSETSHYLLVRDGSLDYEAVPADASTKMDDTLMESIEPYDLSEAVEFNTGYLSGYLANRYDIDAKQCEERANERIRNSTQSAFRSTTTAFDSVMLEHSAIRLKEGTAHYALLPVWLLVTTYQGQKYTFAMNGQTGRIVGDLPSENSEVVKNFAVRSVQTAAVCYGAYLLYSLLNSMGVFR